MEGALYNPFHFESVREGTSVRYEIAFKNAESASVIVKPRSCQTKAKLIVPISGRVLVYDGYDFYSHHRRQNFYLQPELKSFGLVDNWFRFALDLVPTDESGRFFRTDGSHVEDWFGWGMPVRAPASGVVVAVRNTEVDNDQIGAENKWKPRKLSEDEMNSDGNYILIDHGKGEFSNLSHLKQDSIKVKKGDRVDGGEIIAEVGDSGSSLFPHLHYELRTGLGVRGIRSLPPYFVDLMLVGEKTSTVAVPINTGDIVVAR